MKMNLCCAPIFAFVALAMVSLSAQAGGWEVWTEKKGADQLTVVASFAGDSKIEDAHLDLAIGSGFEVVDIQTVQKGAVCAASTEKGLLRALPPSGAGAPLAKTLSDTCVFTVRITASKGWAPESLVEVEKNLCSSSFTGLLDCEVSIRALK